MCVCVCMYVCRYEYKDVCMHACMYICIYVCTLLFYSILRRKTAEEELHQMLWKVKFDEIEFTKKRAGSVVSLLYYCNTTIVMNCGRSTDLLYKYYTLFISDLC